MQGRKRTVALLVVMGAIFGAMLGGTQVAHGDGVHVTWVNGKSDILAGSCEYEWKKDAAGEPIRDELGIPQPSQLPPVCRDDNPSQAGVQIKGCNLKRNLGTYRPYWRNADVTKGEVGLNPPCLGNLSADIIAPFPVGCADINSTNPSQAFCDLVAPTWFYGYCGQTYGGASSGLIKLHGNTKTYVIERLGFTRGRGAWEFGVRAHDSANTASKLSFRFYLAAIPHPDHPDAAAGCDGGPPLKAVEFMGFVQSPPAPVKTFRTKPGWHFCADDPPFLTRPPAEVENC